MHFKNLITSLFLVISFSDSYTLCGQDIVELRKEGDLAFERGEFEKAMSLAKRQVEVAAEKHGHQSSEYAYALKDYSVGLFYNDRVEEALDTIYRSMELYTIVKGKNSKEYWEALSNYGGMMYGMGELNKAEEINQECKQILISISMKETKEYGQQMNNIAEIQRMQGKFDEALDNFKEAQSVYESINKTDTIDYAIILKNIASVYMDLWDYENANKIYQIAIAKFESLKGKESVEYAGIQSDYADLLSNLNRLEEALALHISVAEIYLNHFGPESIDYAISLHNQASVYEKLTNYKRAEQLYIRTLEIKEIHKDRNYSSYCNTVNQISSFYCKLGNCGKGIKILTDLLAEMKSKDLLDTPQYLFFLRNLANLQCDNQDFSNAEANLKECLTRGKDIYGQNHPEYSIILTNLGYVAAKNGNLKKAESLYKQSLSVIEKDHQDDKEGLADIYNNLSEIYRQQNDYLKAEEYIQKSLNIAIEIFGEIHPKTCIYLFNQSIIYYNSNNYAKAIPVLKSALELNFQFLKTNFSFLSEQEKFNYFKTVSHHFEFFNTFCLNASSSHPDLIEEMFNFNLETKSLILNHTSLIHDKIGKSKNEYLKAKFNIWREKRELLASFYNLKKSELTKKGINIEQLENEVNQIEKELVTVSSEFENVVNSSKFSWRHVKDKLKEHEAVVEIVRVQQHKKTWEDSILYVALIVTKQCTDRPFMVIMPDGKKMERKYFKTYLNGVKFDKVSSDLYNVYWKDIDKYLEGKTVVYLSPSGIYNKISIPSLKMSDGKYLLEQKQIQIMPGLKNFLSFQQVPNSTNHAVLFGYPNYNLNLNSLYSNDSTYQEISGNGVLLEEIERGFILNELPGTKVEVERVSDILIPSGLNVTKYLGNDALESKLKAVQNPKVLHIATHGFFMKDEELKGEDADITYNAEKAIANPLLRSGVLLAGANYSLANRGSINTPEDGILTAYEAMHFNLNETDLVILSACETGLGEELNGEGVLGLQRAFQIAGAKNVLMSLWTVSDQGTQELMHLFYQHWIKDKNVSSAFRKAQLDLMKKYPSPYYWAAFVVVGVN